jgi:hypothetical protein
MDIGNKNGYLSLKLKSSCFISFLSIVKDVLKDIKPETKAEEKYYNDILFMIDNYVKS